MCRIFNAVRAVCRGRVAGVAASIARAVVVVLTTLGAAIENTLAQELPRRDLYGDELPAAARARIGTLRLQHGRQVAHVAFINEGRELVSLGSDRAVSVWDVASRRERLRIADSELEPQRMDVSAKAQLVALSYGKAGVRLWRLTDGRPLTPFGAADLVAERLAFTGDGEYLATTNASWGNQIRLWKLDSGEEIKRFPAVREPIFSMVFSADGKHLATARETSSLRFWDVATGQIRHAIKEDHGWAFQLAFDPRGEVLASTDSQNAVHLWSVATGQRLRSFTGHTDSVSNVAFLPDGKRVVTDANDGTVRVWDAETGRELRSWEVSAPKAYNRALAIAPDGRTLAVTSSLKLFDLETGAELSPRPPGGGPLAWSRTGETMLTGDTALLLCDPDNGQTLRRFELPRNEVLLACRFTDGNDAVVGLTIDGRLLRWRTATGELLAERQLDAHVCAALSPDAKFIALGLSNDVTTVVDTSTGVPYRSLGFPPDSGMRPSTRGVTKLAWSNDGRQLVAATCSVAKQSPGTLRVWDVAAGRMVRELAVGSTLLSSSPLALAFAPDGQMIVARSSDEHVRMWDALTGQEIYFERRGGKLEALAFSPDGRWLAIGADRDIVIVPTLAPQFELRRLVGHRNTIRELSFSPDGRWLASASSDGTTLIWEPGELSVPVHALRSDELVEQLCRELASADGATAFTAMRRMVAASDETMPYLEKFLQPPTGMPNRDQLDRWIEQLGDADFAAREAASDELRKLGSWSRPALESAKSANRYSLETRQRVRRLLGFLEIEPYTATERRTLRAIRLLEFWNTDDSRRQLAEIAAWDSGHVEPAFAQAALSRLQAE